MAEPQISGEITEIVRSIGRIGPELAIGPDARLVEDLGLDSLALVEVIMKLEDRFGVAIDDDESAALRTVRELSRYVESRRGGAAAA